MGPIYEVTSDRKWKYKLILPYRYINNKLDVGNVEAQSTSDSDIFIKIHDDVIFIGAGYAWDGATCVPTFKNVLRATLIHDALCQCWNEGLIISRKTIDKIFLDIMKEDKFFWRYPYYWGVRLYDKLFAKRKPVNSLKITYK